MQNRIVCLVGLHGSGKTTIGRALARPGRHIHVSIGDLGRIARRGRAPEGIPTRLITSLMRHAPGTALPPESATLLIDYLTTLTKATDVSIDGFPSHPSHVPLLPPSTLIWHVALSKDDVREARLLRRAEVTARKWVSGRGSERDSLLASTLDTAAQLGLYVREILNDDPVEVMAQRCRAHLGQDETTQVTAA